MDLEWENGRIRIRDLLSSRTQCTASGTKIPFSSCSSSQSHQDNNGRYTNQKKPIFGIPNLCADHRPQLSPQLSQPNLNVSSKHDNTSIVNKNIGNIIYSQKAIVQHIPSTKQIRNESVSVENDSHLLGDIWINHSASSKSWNFQQCQPAGYCIKSKGHELTNLKQQDPTRENKKKGLMNFSPFSGPAALVKSIITSTSTGNPTTSPGFANPERFIKSAKDEMKSSSPVHINPRRTPQIDPAHASQNAEAGIKTQPRPLEAETPSYQQSEALLPGRVALADKKSHDQASDRALSHQESAVKGKTDNKKDMEPFTATCCSACSREASNQPQYTLKRKFQEIKEPTDHDSDADEKETQDVNNIMPAREGYKAKKLRKFQVHNLSEKRRRDRINKKIRALQELIPNCKKVDKASILDEAIEYLRTLQLQLQIMRVIKMRLSMPPTPIMLTPAMQHMNAPQLNYCSPMGTSSSISGITPTLPGMGFGRITTLQMEGMPNQLLPILVPPTLPFSTTLSNGNSQIQQ